MRCIAIAISSWEYYSNHGQNLLDSFSSHVSEICRSDTGKVRPGFHSPCFTIQMLYTYHWRWEQNWLQHLLFFCFSVLIFQLQFGFVLEFHCPKLLDSFLSIALFWFAPLSLNFILTFIYMSSTVRERESRWYNDSMLGISSDQLITKMLVPQITTSSTFDIVQRKMVEIRGPWIIRIGHLH